MLDQETKRKIDSARDILVGKVPDPKAQVEQITIALMYKFMEDMDIKSRELGGKARFFTGEFERYSWSSLMDSRVGGFDRLNLYSEALLKMSLNPKLPQLFRDIFKGAFLPYRDPETLNLFLKEINIFQYDHSERLGDAFEYLLSVLGSQGEAGQFRTPRHIIDFIVEIVAPRKDETVLDPACGTAGFLISAYKHILKNNMKKHPGDKLTPDEKKKVMNHFTGYDISPDMVRLSRVNMYLHGFQTPYIYEYDTLTSEDKWQETADVILANPPFMSPKGGIRPHKRFSVQASRSEVLFVDYMAEHLNVNGRAGIIVPEGIIFQSANAYKALRKMLIENYLYAVVSLPAGVFNPYAGVKTSILLLDKALAKKTKDILFVKIQNDGFDLGAQRRPIGKNDLPEALKIIKEYQKTLVIARSEVLSLSKDKATPVRRSQARKLLDEGGKQSLYHLVPKKKIVESGDYNLSGDRYKETAIITNHKWPMVELREICEFIGGYAFKSSELLKEKLKNSLPVIKIGNLIDKGTLSLEEIQYYHYSGDLSNYLIKNEDILIAMTGATVGKVSVSDLDNVLLNQRVGLIRSIRDKALQSYLKYFLFDGSFYKYCQITAGGGAQGNIAPKQILQYKIPLPPLEIQQQIISELDNYQKIIDSARQIVQTYKPQIKINPEWEMVELGDDRIFKIESGGTPDSKKVEYWNGDVNWVTLVDLPSDDFITNLSGTQRKISKLGLKDSSAKLLPEKSILVSSRATIGRIAVTKIPVATNQGFKNVAIKDFGKANEYFVAYMISTLVNKMQNIASGGTFKEISKTDFSRLKIPLPSLKIQHQIVSQLEQEQKLIEANKKIIEVFEKKIKGKIAELWR